MADNVHPVTAAFEKEVSQLEELDDPLSVFERYYSYLSSVNDQSGALTKLLERATQTFVDDQRYRNDLRYLRLWLEYAKRCREPEDIYAFLAMRGIAAGLASYYEDYAMYLETKGDGKARLVLQTGVEKNAQPIERLRKKLCEYQTRHQQEHSQIKKGLEEIKGYKLEIINPPGRNCEISFEEARSKSWRRAGSILKTSYVPPAPLPSNLMALDEGLYGFDDDGADVDPDELTHISVYKDNTTDLRELARSLGKENVAAPSNFQNMLVSFDQFIKDKDDKTLLTAKPMVEDILDEFVVQQKQQRQHTTIPNNQACPVKENTTSINNINNDDLTFCTRQRGEEIAFDSFANQASSKNNRLSLIPEESDMATSVSGMIPALLSRPIISKVFLDEHRTSILKTGQFQTVSERIGEKLEALAKKIGRDGQGNNQTVASIRTVVGHFFVERRLSKTVLLAVDLEADLSSSDLHQVALKSCTSLIEPFLLGQLATIKGIPKLGKVCCYSDIILFTRAYYPHGSLANIPKVEEKLVIFWIRELAHVLCSLHKNDIIHGAISIDHVLVRLGTRLLSKPSFDPTGAGGWDDRGIALCGFSKSFKVDDLIRNGDLEESSTVEASSIPAALCTIDLCGLAQIMEHFLNICSSSLSSGLKYPELWNRIRSAIKRAVVQLPTWQSVLSTYDTIIACLDEVLIVDSITIPTLKSLLTKLEISLLETRSPCTP